ncbi:MAG: PRC-barrel domain-containing protein, partial [Verrucomicrobiales bacterium]
ELHAADGSIGEIKDFIIDDETWKIRFLIVEPRYWWLGSRIAVSAEWIWQVNWSEGRLSLTLPRTTVQVAPALRGGLALHS